MKCSFCGELLTEDQIRRKGSGRSKASYCSRLCSNTSLKGVRKRLSTTPEERFLKKVEKQADGCWLWIGAMMPTGYGRFGYTDEEGKLINDYAHRISHLFFKGELIDGLVIDHLCEVKKCVNPQHLELVTPRENVMRAGTSPSAIGASQTSCIHGHPFDEENTYHWKGQRRCRACGRNRKRKDYKRVRDLA